MYTVSRQHQWPDGNNVVEISCGGIDYTNPDALSPKYPGELCEYESPVEAVEVAIEIASTWQADCPKDIVEIAYGSTGGMTMPFDGEPLTDDVFAGLRAWAEKEDSEYPYCEHCGDRIFCIGRLLGH